MREILFRGKRLDNGEWVEGNLVIATDRINSGNAYILPSVSDFSYGDNGNRIRIGCFVEVDPSTIGQDTGLCDKNDKKIFEGDVVRRNACPMRITWDDFDGSFITECFIDDVRCINSLAEYSKLEVIGNVYDNRELLNED